MKVFKIEDLKTIQAEQGYKYFGLFDQTGAVIIPFNPNRITAAERLREIETRLTSSGMPDGYYIVKCKNTTAKNVKSDDFTFYKGSNLSEAPPAPQIVEKPVFQPEVLTYEGALKLQIELERLKLDNAALKKELAQKEELIKSLESEAATLSEEGNPGMWENAKSFLSEIVAIGAPMLDKHFELKEKQLALKAIELQTRPGIQQNRKPQAVQDPTKNQQRIESWILTKQDDPDTYENLAAIYNAATDQENFLKTLKIYNNDLFNELEEWNRN